MNPLHFRRLFKAIELQNDVSEQSCAIIDGMFFIRTNMWLYMTHVTWLISVINMPDADGYCNAENSNIFTRKCRDVFDDQKLFDDSGQGPFWVHRNYFTFWQNLKTKSKELTSWDNLDKNICMSFGCCPLTNVSTGINECTIVQHDLGVTRTAEPLRFRIVSQK